VIVVYGVMSNVQDTPMLVLPAASVPRIVNV
jgi:hypothetical protein